MPFQTDAPQVQTPDMLDVAAFRARLEEAGLVGLIDHWLNRVAPGCLPSRRDSYEPPRDLHDLHQHIQAAQERQGSMTDWTAPSQAEQTC